MGNKPAQTITQTRRAVWELIARGLPTKAIATRLGKSEATVKVQIRDLLQLQRCSNRVQLALHFHGLEWEER